MQNSSIFTTCEKITFSTLNANDKIHKLLPEPCHWHNVVFSQDSNWFGFFYSFKILRK